MGITVKRPFNIFLFINKQWGLCKHRGNFRNGRCKRHGGASTGPINQTFGKNHHRYVHGLKTKEVIAMRKLAAEMTKSFIDLIRQA